MDNKKRVAYGIFQNRADLEGAVDRLKTDDFSQEDISVLMPDKESSEEFAHENATKAPEGVTAGAVGGAAAGGALGWLVGAGSLAIPGLGPFVAAGPIMGALAGAGAGGTLGGLAGALVGMGFPEYEAKRYAGYVEEGGMLLSVHSDNSEQLNRAKDILETSGAREISSSTEAEPDQPRPGQINDERPDRMTGPYTI